MTVATVVVRDGQLLMVEERAHDKLVFNQPAGHLEPDESLSEAALRETREETGWDVELTAFIGAYQWKAVNPDGSAGRHYLRFAFAAEALTHDATRTLDEGIVQALWMTPATPRNSSAAPSRGLAMVRLSADPFAAFPAASIA